VVRRKRMTTGYSVTTLRNRTEELTAEVVKMGRDGRITPDEAIKLLPLAAAFMSGVAEIIDERRRRR